MVCINFDTMLGKFRFKPMESILEHYFLFLPTILKKNLYRKEDEKRT